MTCVSTEVREVAQLCMNRERTIREVKHMPRNGNVQHEGWIALALLCCKLVKELLHLSLCEERRLKV